MSSFRMNRREFIGAIGAAAFAAVANTRAAESPSVAPAGMQKRAIPSSGEQLPAIGMGTSGTFDVGATEAERAPLVEVLRLLFDGGGTLIDTAPSYGRAETVTGDLLQQGDWRQRAFLATKISARAGAGARSGTVRWQTCAATRSISSRCITWSTGARTWRSCAS